MTNYLYEVLNNMTIEKTNAYYMNIYCYYMNNFKNLYLQSERRV